MSTPIVTPNLLQQMRTVQAPAIPAPTFAPQMPSLPAIAPSVLRAPGARTNELGALLPSSGVRRNELGGYLPGDDSPEPVATQAPHIPTQLERDQNHRNDLVNSGSGIDQIHNPLLRGIARAGDIGLSVFGAISPIGTLLNAALPGTTLHHQVLVRQAERNLANDQAAQKAADASAQSEATTDYTKANTQHVAAETPEVAPNAASTRNVQTATARHLNDESDNLENPQPEFEVHDTEAGPLFINKQTGEARHLNVNGLPVGPKMQTKTVQLQVGGRPHQVLVNDSTGDVIKDLGESGEKPPTVNVNAGMAALDRETKQFGTPYQKSLDAANAQLEKIADARAMINGNAESQGLGIPKVLTALVGGQGTGVRITQAELTSIAHARGLSGDVEGTLNKWAGKGQLSKEQQRQLTQIMDDVKARLVQKQAIASETLDSVNGASSREQIIEADKAARKRLTDLETSTGSSAPSGADNEVYVAGKLVGHTVGGKYVPLGNK